LSEILDDFQEVIDEDPGVARVALERAVDRMEAIFAAAPFTAVSWLMNSTAFSGSTSTPACPARPTRYGSPSG
jgi:hypothetical protein